MTPGPNPSCVRVVHLGAALFLAACVPPADPAATQGSTTGPTSSDTAAPTESGSNAGSEATNQLPPVPILASPGDGASERPLETELCWELVEDPDGDPLRYHVFIDGAALGDGVLDEDEGYEGPCLGPLLFAHERSYTWQVEAFEVEDPSHSSGRSEAWSFSTIGDGMSELVFLEDFELDETWANWTVEGDALTGAWIRDQPQMALDMDALSQPSDCPNSSKCALTGQNPDGIAELADVSGGSTSLVSPAFDLSGANAATVRLTRFFYKSGLMPGPQLRVELLVPHEPADGDYEVHALEILDAGTPELPANSWAPQEYAACGITMRAETRLRITATDQSSGILEAAIDDVSVHAFDDPSLCAPGLGGVCDPLQPDNCDPGQLCCSQGVLNRGIFRCEEPIAGLDFDVPTASPDAPGNGPPGCDAPDLIIDAGILDPLFTDIFMSEDTCELLEGCVGGPGWRSVMLFTVATPNIGSKDLALGVPANLPELFHYSPCHDHYHFDEFARYELRDGDTVVATGHKQAFCLLDTISWAWPLAPNQFDCSNQGVSRGFSDFYESGLPCQWVDVTGVAPGDYTLRIRLNEARPEQASPMLNERDYSNNMLEFAVSLP